jgi:glycosyltransferase involved in cell wall biosynthesis
MKIAFIRGPFLNPWELQTYLPLQQDHEFRAIGADWQVYARPMTGLQRPPVMAHLWAASSARLHASLPVALNRLRSWTMGESFGLSDLDRVTGDAEILHSAETYTTLTWQCLQIRKRRPCKVVATIWENIPGMGETHPRRRKRKHQALRELDGFLAVTETSRRMLLEEGAPKDRIEVIPMAVDLERFKPMAKDSSLTKSWALAPDEKVVLFVGRFVEEKGIQELLKAIPEVLARIPFPVRFCFAGAGPLERDLRAAALRYRGRVQVISFVAYDQLPTLHNMADLFVLPSKPAPKWQEQFGYVLAESMACGKPIVTTRTGSIPDVVGKAAALAPPGNAAALACTIVELLDSEPWRAQLGRLARRHAEEHFDAGKNARRIESFYERVLKRPS